MAFNLKKHTCLITASQSDIYLYSSINVPM